MQVRTDQSTFKTSSKVAPTTHDQNAPFVEQHLSQLANFSIQFQYLPNLILQDVENENGEENV